MARIGIIGSEGRMGQALARAIADAGHEGAGGIDRGGDPAALADRSDVEHRQMAPLFEQAALPEDPIAQPHRDVGKRGVGAAEGEVGLELLDLLDRHAPLRIVDLLGEPSSEANHGVHAQGVADALTDSAPA